MRQFAFVVIGTGIMGVAALVDYHKLHDWAWLFYGATTVLLVLVLSPLGTGASQKGAQAWFDVGPFQLQPAEFAKLSLIGALAFLLSEFRGRHRPPPPGRPARHGRPADGADHAAARHRAGPDPDDHHPRPARGGRRAHQVPGRARGGRRRRRGRGAQLAGAEGVPTRPPHRLHRPVGHERRGPLQRRAEPAGDRQRRCLRPGPVPGAPDPLGFVPEQETDFIFTAVAEQFGFVGSALVLGLYGVVCYRIWRIASIARDPFGSYVCIGVLAMFAFSVFENVGHGHGDHAGDRHPAPVAQLGRLLHHHRVRRHRAGPQRPHAPVPVERPPAGSIPRMNGMWPQLEPLLAKVAKPARYIGLEDGAQRPDHSADRVAWLLAYPDTYEIGLPNQGLQILYEILNERPDAVAERTYAPWVDLEELLRARGPAPVLARHPPARQRLRRAGLQPLGRADLHEPAQHGRPGRGARAGRRPPPRAPARGRRRALHVQPRAHRRLPRLRRAGRRRGDRQRDHRGPRRLEGLRTHRGQPRARAARALPHHRRLRALHVRVHLRRGRPGGGHAPVPRRARPGREAHRPRPGRLPVPQEPARAHHRGGARPAQRRGLPGLHPGLPLLPGGDDHPARCASAPPSRSAAWWPTA